MEGMPVVLFAIEVNKSNWDISRGMYMMFQGGEKRWREEVFLLQWDDNTGRSSEESGTRYRLPIEPPSRTSFPLL